MYPHPQGSRVGSPSLPAESRDPEKQYRYKIDMHGLRRKTVVLLLGAGIAFVCHVNAVVTLQDVDDGTFHMYIVPDVNCH